MKPLRSPCSNSPQSTGGGSRETPDLAAQFRLAMQQFASGVCLVTHGEGEARTGLTATGVSALSVEPPTLVVCVNRSASLPPSLARGVRFGVSVLGAHQAEYADRFASRTGLRGAERFREGRWAQTPANVSVLADALAIFECVVEDVVERHSHAIVVGRVTFAASQMNEGALLCWRGSYDRIGWSAEEIARAIGTHARSDALPTLHVVS